jgi:hypothetical protein
VKTTDSTAAPVPATHAGILKAGVSGVGSTAGVTTGFGPQADSRRLTAKSRPKANVKRFRDIIFLLQII